MLLQCACSSFLSSVRHSRADLPPFVSSVTPWLPQQESLRISVRLKDGQCFNTTCTVLHSLLDRLTTLKSWTIHLSHLLAHSAETLCAENRDDRERHVSDDEDDDRRNKQKRKGGGGGGRDAKRSRR